MRTRVAARTASVPARVPTDPLPLGDERRYRVPVTVLFGAADQEAFTAMLTEWPPYADEFARVRETEVVQLDSGHWPQFSQPDRLGTAIVAAVDREG